MRKDLVLQESHMPFATLKPRKGAEHSPNTPGGAWSFAYNGEWQRITNEDGTPRALPVAVAQHALEFFTPSAGDDTPPECLVEITIHEGEMSYRPAPKHRFVMEETGEEFETQEAFVAAVRAHYARAGGGASEQKAKGK
jgi:hypothetical protein